MQCYNKLKPKEKTPTTDLVPVSLSDSSPSCRTFPYKKKFNEKPNILKEKPFVKRRIYVFANYFYQIRESLLFFLARKYFLPLK